MGAVPAYWRGVGQIESQPRRCSRSCRWRSRQRGELQASGRYTDAGVTEQLLAVVPDAARALRKAERATTRAKAEIEKRGAQLTIKHPDPSDVAAAKDRQQIRGWLRGMTQDQRRRLLSRQW